MEDRLNAIEKISDMLEQIKTDREHVIQQRKVSTFERRVRCNSKSSSVDLFVDSEIVRRKSFLFSF